MSEQTNTQPITIALRKILHNILTSEDSYERKGLLIEYALNQATSSSNYSILRLFKPASVKGEAIAVPVKMRFNIPSDDVLLDTHLATRLLLMYSLTHESDALPFCIIVALLLYLNLDDYFAFDPNEIAKVYNFPIEEVHHTITELTDEKILVLKGRRYYFRQPLGVLSHYDWEVS